MWQPPVRENRRLLLFAQGRERKLAAKAARAPHGEQESDRPPPVRLLKNSIASWLLVCYSNFNKIYDKRRRFYLCK